MIAVDLQPFANQSFSIQLDESRYDLTFKEAAGVMCATVVRDDVTLVEGVRLVAGEPVLPYAHMQLGNFVLYTQDDELPYYDKFGSTQFLVYVSAQEIEDARGT